MNPIYAKRRRRDIIIRTLCFGAALFGVTWLALILFTLFFNGLKGHQSRALHPEHAAARRQRRRPSERHHRLHHHDRDRRRPRRAARPVCRDLPGRIRQERPPHIRDPLHQRHPPERAVDHHRPVHLWRHRGADARLLGSGGFAGACGDRDSGRGAHHRGHAAAGSQSAARGRLRARLAALAGHQAHRLPRGALGPDHRRAARNRPRRRRDRAACCSPRSPTSSSAST